MKQLTKDRLTFTGLSIFSYSMMIVTLFPSYKLGMPIVLIVGNIVLFLLITGMLLYAYKVAKENGHFSK
jgi:hypothetical protein